MHITAQRLFTFILALWVGTLTTIGYIVAPTLFATLTDRQVAGMVAGALFRIEGTISMVLSVALIMFANLLVLPALVLTFEKKRAKKEDLISFKDRADLLFIGSIHAPNIDALYFLHNEINIWVVFLTLIIS